MSTKSTAQIRPYAEFRSGDRSANDAHYWESQRLGRPMVMVKMGRRNADLEWDCITIDPNDEGYLFGDDNGSAFVGSMYERFRALTKGTRGRPEFFGSSFTGTIKRLPPPTARLLAEEFSRMLRPPARASA